MYMNNHKSLVSLCIALRPEQWIKNLFLFLPLVFGKQLFNFPTNLQSCIAFFLFSLTASAIYLLNDIFDIEKDKAHPVKKTRPLAAGHITTRQAFISALALGLFSLILAFILNPYFALVLVIYIILNVLYSIFLKNIVIIDVFCIATFFLLRIAAGGIIAQVEISQWIVLMTALLALFLGFNKRRQELSTVQTDSNESRTVLSHYNTYFIDQMIAVITSSIVVVYMLYTIDSNTIMRFETKQLIYTIPFVYYGIFRYLYQIHKIQSDGEPTTILLSDKTMQINLILWIAVCVFVIYF